MESQIPSNDDYDTPWKDALTRYFPEFMAFYFPLAAAEIDWQQPHVFLDQELAQVLYERHWSKQRIIDLFGVIDWLMRLPTELEQRLLQEVYLLEWNVNRCASIWESRFCAAYTLRGTVSGF